MCLGTQSKTKGPAVGWPVQAVPRLSSLDSWNGLQLAAETQVWIQQVDADTGYSMAISM